MGNEMRLVSGGVWSRERTKEAVEGFKDQASWLGGPIYI